MPSNRMIVRHNVSEDLYSKFQSRFAIRRPVANKQPLQLHMTTNTFKAFIRPRTVYEPFLRPFIIVSIVFMVGCWSLCPPSICHFTWKIYVKRFLWTHTSALFMGLDEIRFHFYHKTTINFLFKSDAFFINAKCLSIMKKKKSKTCTQLHSYWRTSNRQWFFLRRIGNS